jgi:hypothetical protein
MKNSILGFLLLLGVSIYAQSITISQNVDPNTINAASVVCRVNEEQVDEEEGLFLGMYFDNHFARSFDLQNDHNIDTGFQINTIAFGQGFGRNITVDINIYSANTDDLSDPNLDLVLLETVQVPIFEANTGEILFISADATIPAGEVLVVEIFAPSSGDAINEEFFVGINDSGQTKPTYIKAPDCETGSFVVASSVGPGDEAYIMSITGEETLSINQAELDKIKIFPNPVINTINLNLPAGLILESSRITDMSGRRFQIDFIDGVMDVTNLATGQYILNLETSAGNYTHKVIKK